MSYWNSFTWAAGLQSRISSLPLVIAGPILRTVKKDEVSVWIALKSSDTVTLKVYDNAGNVIINDSASTISLGTNLHVCLVTAASGSPYLSPGLDYTYNLFFSGNKDLGSAGVLNDSTSTVGAMSLLTYGSFTRPSFSLAPASLADLRIVHSSCRKPHGQGPDALEAIHTMINGVMSGGSIANKRPHQLFLTGDQIYSDDVADALLHMIIDADKYLIDRAETLPSVTADPPLPGKRSTIMRGTAKFTSGVKDSKSHLMKLNEFYCMYLFAWSPVLWPTTLPDFATVRPNEITTYTARYGPQNTQDYTTFLDEIKYLNYFKSSLPNIRKALANVPVYMIFDDHEITDDWFLNRNWVNKVYASGLGKRVIANGLAAYAVFQDWGNVFLRYYNSSYPGYNLLNLLKVNNIAFSSVESMVLPTYNATTKCLEHSGTQPDWNYTIQMDNYEVIVLDSRTLREFPTLYHNAALISDASMTNQIPTLSNAAIKLTILVAPSPVFGVPRVEDIQDTLSGNSDSGAINYDMEGWGIRQRENDTLQYLLSHLTGRTASGNPQLGRVVILSGDVHYSSSQRIEFWATKLANQPTNYTGNFHLVIAQCTASSAKNEIKSATGSYNVHFIGYKIPGIPSNNPSDPKKVFGWRTNGTLQVGSHYYVENMYTSTPIPIVVTKAKPILDYDLEVKNKTENQNLRDMFFTVVQTTFINDFTSGPAPDWVYRVDYITDITGEGRPNTNYTKSSVPSPPYANRPAALAAYLAQANNETLYMTLFKSGKAIVGKNNIGELSFLLDTNGALKTLVHTLWWQLRSGAASNSFLGLFPLTTHSISLQFSDPNYPKPTL